MGEEFYGIIKLITGEEIFAMITVEENDGTTMLLVQNPVIMKVLNNGTGQYVKVKPWLELSNEDMFIINYDRIVTMSEVKDEQMIKFYQRYLEDDSLDIEIDGKVSINPQMGFISTVEEARIKLEELYKLNIES
tara:strand:+ start:477 stop:878 length:402 start_codon:yes stop_codon:yes gene_type:complete